MSFLLHCTFACCAVPRILIILLMEEFWEESKSPTSSCQELSDPSCFSDPFIILGTGWEGGFHTCAERSLFYLQLSLLIITHFFFFMHGPTDPFLLAVPTFSGQVFFRCLISRIPAKKRLRGITPVSGGSPGSSAIILYFYPTHRKADAFPKHLIAQQRPAQTDGHYFI